MSRKPKTPRVGIDAFGGYKIKSGEDNHALGAVEMGKDLIVVGISTWEGKPSIDIRKYFLTPGPEEIWHPTKQGIRIPSNHVGEILDFIHGHRDLVLQLLGETR